VQPISADRLLRGVAQRLLQLSRDAISDFALIIAGAPKGRQDLGDLLTHLYQPAFGVCASRANGHYENAPFATFRSVPAYFFSSSSSASRR